MKVDRRSFLGLGLGAAAGITVSPVAVKLIDDSSIWTQNWPWTPVPQDGEITYENSVCSLCPGSCGLTVRKIKNRPVKIEGREDYPVNQGGACLHGMSNLQYLYDPARVQTPMKKVGDRFQSITWTEALDLVGTKINDARKAGRPETLGCLTRSSSGSVNQMFARFMDSYGSPNTFTMPSLEGMLSLTAQTLHGDGQTIGFDLENSDFILSFGAGVLEGWGTPTACFKANSARKDNKGRLIQIEPRLSRTAANADKWIPINPGTEADLALGICAVLIEKNIFTPGDFSGNFNKFAIMIQKAYAPAKVEALTGIKAAQIEELAVAFAKAKAAVAVPGKGRGDYGQNLKEFAAIQALNALAGRLNKKGGAFVMNKADYLSFPEVIQDAKAKAGNATAKVAASLEELVDALNGADKPALETLFIYNANPCYTLRNPQRVKDALKKVPFVVAFSSFMDETAMEADVVLPMPTIMERTEDVVAESGLAKSVVGLTKAMVKPMFNTMAPGDVLIALAKDMTGSMAQNFAWSSYEACLEDAAADIWDDLASQGYAVLSEGAPGSAPGTSFAFLAENPSTAPVAGSGDMILVPVDNMRLTASSTSASPFAVKTVSDKVIFKQDSVVEINPATAKGLKDGGYATIKTAQGSAKVKVSFNEGIMPGVIGMVKGLGHTFDNPYVAGKGVNINDLIAPALEPGSGVDAAFAVKATISRA